MKVSRHPLMPEVLIIEPQLFGDERGLFFESFQQERYASFGIRKNFVQDNISRSKQGTLRGLHYQLKHPQAKLIGVVRGKVFDVVVDIRRQSKTFGRWISFELGEENHQQIYIPEGFAHGFQVISEVADFYYKCTDYYVAHDDYGIIWNDPTLNINWPLILIGNEQPILSIKDQGYPQLAAVNETHLPC